MKIYDLPPAAARALKKVIQHDCDRCPRGCRSLWSHAKNGLLFHIPKLFLLSAVLTMM
ncbi:hypothetical protein MPTK1_2g05180 [Marchantia polymorpha subsp. ruderalis]|nr:hypothetical protein Mp_2g05180 [Marchantia polymorpha subsp. ruderalis]